MQMAMGHTNLKGPARQGAGILDEGYLTAWVAEKYAIEDGSRGQEAAEEVPKAREALWAATQQHMPLQLAEALRGRLREDDQTGLKGVAGIRRAVVDWLDPPARCKYCKQVMTDGWRFCGGRLCVGEKIFNTHTIHEDQGFISASLEATAKGIWNVLIDRDGKSLLAVTDPSKPLHPDVWSARIRFDRALEEGVIANGRLVLKTQLKFYSAAGAVTRADLLQGGAMGCRRGLIDYDPSKAAFSTYGVTWIRQGIGDTFARRDLLGTPDELLLRRRKIEALGVDPLALLNAISMCVDCRFVDHNRQTLLAIKNIVSVIGVKLSLEEEEVVINDLLVVMTSGTHKLSRERKMEQIACWSSKLIDTKEGTRRYVRTKASKTGSGLLSALRHGSPQMVSPKTFRDDSEDNSEYGNDIFDISSRTIDPHLELEKMWQDNQRYEIYKKALESVCLEDPEAGECFCRHSGLLGFQEETLEQIASTSLKSSGRRICRESVRKLTNRGSKKLQARLRAEHPFVVPTKKAVVSEVSEPIEWKTSYSEPISSPVDDSDFDSWKSSRTELDSIAW